MFEQIIINGIIAGSIYAVVALGFALIYRTTKFFHIAHGVVYSLGAYGAYAFTTVLGLPRLVAFFLAIVLSTILGIIIDIVVYRPLRFDKAPKLVFLIASFGLFILFQNLIQIFFGAKVLTWPKGLIVPGRSFLGAVITDVQLMIILSGLIVFAFLSISFNKTKLGKAIHAVSDDPLAASIVGIAPDKIILLSMAIGSILAAAAGILISFETSIEPWMGFNAILKGITASVIGGIGSIPGAVLGALFLGLIENLGIWIVPSAWKDCIAFVILLLFLLIRPNGILGVNHSR